MVVLILTGGYGLEGSCGLVVGDIVSRLEQKGVEYRVFRNDSTILPIIGEPDCWNSDAVKQLKDLASSSSAIILVSPEYHGTMSSTMKLQLDWLSKDELSRKPIGLVSLLGGTSNTSTLNHMRHVCRWLGAICIPEQIAIPEGRTHLEDGKISNPDLSNRLDTLIDSLLEITDKLS